MQLFLELVVNERASGQVVPVLLRDGHFHVAAEALRALHVRTDSGPDTQVAVDLLPEVRVVYDAVGQRLNIFVPPGWLPEQSLGEQRSMGPFTAESGQGVLLNYDVYASNPGRSTSNLSVWSELRGFGAWGALSNTGVYRRGGSGTSGTYVRYDTRWTYADTDRIRSYSAGDLIAAPLAWGSAVRIGGAQVARNYAIRPDLVTFPLPEFAGQAAVPSAVDLFINGYKAGSDRVEPGPFTMPSAPYLTGAGEAAVVTTDALGRQVTTTIPFYVANTLLVPGTDEYAVAAGALRRDYGLRNFAYGPPVASAGLRRGINRHLTLEGRAEWAPELRVAGAGFVASPGTWGVVNGSLSHSQVRGQRGQQVTLGYQYNAQRFGIGAQHMQRSGGYSDLSLYDSPGARPTRRSTQVNGSLSMGEAGSLAAGYFNVQSADGSRTRLLSASYSRPLTATAFLSLIVNKAIGARDYSVQAQVTWPLGLRGSTTVTATQDRQGQSGQLQFSSTPPPAGGVGWNLGYATNSGSGAYRQVGGIWRTPFTQLQGGVYAQGDTQSHWLGATGSVVAMDGRLLPANRINDAFVLVSTGGVPGVGVRYENQLLGQTDAGGHLLVPGVPGYYPARVEVDLLDLPDHMQVPQPQQRVAVRAGSGSLLRFEITSTVAARITLVDEAGKPLAVGLPVRHVQSGQNTVVGWDGLVYLEGLAAQNELIVSGPGAARCRVRFPAAVDTPQVLRIGPLTCAREAGQRSTSAPFHPLSPLSALGGTLPHEAF